MQSIALQLKQWHKTCVSQRQAGYFSFKDFWKDKELLIAHESPDHGTILTYYLLMTPKSKRIEIELCRALIESGVNLQCPSQLPLFLACKFHSTKLFELLVTAGADVNALQNKKGERKWALIEAIKTGQQVETLNLLIQAGSLLQSRDYSALNFALDHADFTQVFWLVVSAGGNVNWCYQDVQSNLLQIELRWQSARLDRVQLLLQAGINVDYKDSQEETALTVGLKRYGLTPTVKLIMVKTQLQLLRPSDIDTLASYITQYFQWRAASIQWVRLVGKKL